MDGSEFLHRDNLFQQFLLRDNLFQQSLCSLKMWPSQQWIKLKDSPRESIKQTSSANYTEVSETKNLFHHFHTSLNAAKEHGKTGKCEKVCASASGGPRMSPNATKGKKDNHETEPTTSLSSPHQSEGKKCFKARGDEKEMKHKKTSKIHKKWRNHVLLHESTPQDVFFSGFVTENSSGESTKSCVSATGSPYMPTSVTKEEKEDNVIKPTTLSCIHI